MKFAIIGRDGIQEKKELGNNSYFTKYRVIKGRSVEFSIFFYIKDF